MDWLTKKLIYWGKFQAKVWLTFLDNLVYQNSFFLSQISDFRELADGSMNTYRLILVQKSWQDQLTCVKESSSKWFYSCCFLCQYSYQMWLHWWPPNGLVIVWLIKRRQTGLNCLCRSCLQNMCYWECFCTKTGSGHTGYSGCHGNCNQTWK